MTILFFPEISWRGLYQRPHHIARALAKHWPVLWIEPATLAALGSHRPSEVETNIFVMSIPTIPYNARHGVVRFFAKTLSAVKPVRTIVSMIQVAILKRALRTPAFQGTYVAFIYNFHLHDALRKIKPAVRIYDYIDNIFGFTKLPSHVRKLWITTIQTSDVVIATSHELAQQILRYRSGEVQLIGNGVEYDKFSGEISAPRPDDLPQGIAIVGYIGAVYPWLDFDLLEKACQTMPDAQFVLIGPVHPGVKTRIQVLQRNRNIHLLGFKPYLSIPLYLKYFDVGIIPFLRNELTSAVNPVKLYEYSAAGKPTVATNFSEELRQYTSTVHIANSAEDFVPCLNEALKQSRDPLFSKRLREFAQEHDWKNKTQPIIDIIQQRSSG